MWKTVTLADVCEIYGGGTPKSKIEEYWGSEIQWLTPKDMGKLDSRYVTSTKRQISQKGLEKSSAKLIPENSVLLSCRAPIGHLAINQAPMSFNQGCKGLVPNREIDTTYLFYFLLSARELLNDLGTGTTFKEISSKVLAGVKLLLPPLPVQKQIVEKLDAAFVNIDKAISATQKNIANAEALFQRILFDIFDGRHATESTSTVCEIANHCLGKMLDKNKNKGNLQPYLRNTNVQWFSVNTDNALLMKFEPEEEERFSVKKGDLLICEGGYPGRAAIWEKEEAIYFQKALHRVRCKERIYNRWLMYYLYYLSSTNKLTRYFTGAGIQHFTGKSLKKLPIPIPSIQNTNSHVEMLDSLFDQIKSIKNICSEKISLHEKLKSSILNQAFSGELIKDAA